MLNDLNGSFLTPILISLLTLLLCLFHWNSNDVTGSIWPGACVVTQKCQKPKPKWCACVCIYTALCIWILHISNKSNSSHLNIIRWLADLAALPFPPSSNLERRGRWLICFFCWSQDTGNMLLHRHTHTITYLTLWSTRWSHLLDLPHVAAAAGILGMCCLRRTCSTTSVIPSSSRNLHFLYSFGMFHSGKISIQMTNAI